MNCIIYIYTHTKILEVNLCAFAYRLFHRDFSPLDGASCIGTHSFLARRGRMSSERYCHTPSGVVVVVVVIDNFRLKFLFINLSQVKVSVY